MSETRFWLGLVAVLSTVGLLIVSCGDDSTGGAGTATVRVAITDSDDRFDSVVLTVEEIGIVAAHMPTTYYGRDEVVQLPLTLDVLDFPAAQMMHLADIEVPLPDTGELCFNQIRFVLAEEGSAACAGLPYCNYVLEFGAVEPNPLLTPSGQQSGIKLLTPNQFCVKGGETAVSLVIDFDPNVAIGNKEKKSGAYLLKPTGIRVIEGRWDIPPTDHISGTVLLPTAAVDGGCQLYATPPLATIEAEAVADATVPVVTTVSLAEAPLLTADFCLQTCSDDADCLSRCAADLSADCYYSGAYKLLLSQPGDYDVRAVWGSMTGSVANVASSTEGVEVILGN